MGLPLLTINGLNILMPTTHGWLFPGSLGTGGSGNEVLPGIYKYSMEWDILLPSEYNVIHGLWYNNQGISIVAELPEIGLSTYILKTYTCVMNPVIYRNFFEGTYQNVATQLIGIDITI